MTQPALATAAGDLPPPPPSQPHTTLPTAAIPAGLYASPADKPYLGGYRHVVSGRLFHHAATQTPGGELVQRRRMAQPTSAATQTGRPLSRAVQCPHDAATQYCAADTSSGKPLVLTAPYQSAADVQARRQQAAGTIQRCWRGWHGRRAAVAARDAQRQLEAYVAQQAAAAAAAAEALRQKEAQRRMQPRTQVDFLVLYDELAVWWGQEQAKIAAAQGLTGQERQAARRALLAKETKLLQTVDRLKAAAAPLVQAERDAAALAALAAPRVWRLANGRSIEVSTPETLRARELAAAHAALAAPDGSNLDTRLAALLAAKYHAKAVDCSLTREIVALVDREADLLNSRALLWEGRVLTLGSSDGCALVMGRGGLTSRCHAALQLHGGAVWLSDTSRHGTLLLELSEDSASISTSGITAAQLDALPWAGAIMLGGTLAQLPSGLGRRALIISGLRSTDWLAAAKEGQLSRQISEGAALLLYEQSGPLPTVAPAADGAAAVAQPPDLPAAPLPFARTPSRPQPLPRSGSEHRAKSEAVLEWTLPPHRDPPRLGQAYNIFQLPLAAAAKKRAQPGPDAAPPPAKGPAKKKVRWSDEQEDQQEWIGAKPAAGNSKESRSTRRTSKAAGDGGKVKAAVAGPSKENAAQPALGVVAQPTGKQGTAGNKQGGPSGAAGGTAASKSGGKGKAGKGRAKALLRRMQKSLSTAG
ncbi:IQ and ubiquitin-like domain-containing isoform A [Chlorella sorokiniana]|uniref:IQ and ubiquitin-like domain-containing isoform A n=1 Tax=Chlorella sorokiniana TaxID=3076 RepID=A0A2P6TL98_CHLSO|nr:IQ and ubiquitin-like domain-containing isoform A [Chlorella sorokiniana]|eukprot:PRW45054.1 IQ and ubiquitin-like domain-containing isoform A [Chlorella sorokiniana]